MILEEELQTPLPVSIPGGCGGGGMLGRIRGFGAGLEGRGREPEGYEGSDPSWGRVSGGIGEEGGEGSGSSWGWWTGGGCGGGWLGAWMASLLRLRRGVVGCGELGIWVLVDWEATWVVCLVGGGAGACFLVPLKQNIWVKWQKIATIDVQLKWEWFAYLCGPCEDWVLLTHSSLLQDGLNHFSA